MHASKLRRDLGQGDNLIRLGEIARGVEWPGRQTVSTGLHASPHMILHRLQLGVGRSAVVVIEDRDAHGVVPDQRRDVNPGTRGQNVRHLPRQIEGTAAVGVDEHRGDALRDDRTHAGAFLDDQRLASVRMGVDEAGGNVEPARIDHACGRGGGGNRADLDDPVTGDGNVGLPPGRASAIEDPPAADEDVVGLGLKAGGETECE